MTAVRKAITSGRPAAGQDTAPHHRHEAGGSATIGSRPHGSPRRLTPDELTAWATPVMKLAAVGECTRDVYVDRRVATVGGISLNFAVQARQSLGSAGRVALVSCTGDDAAGHAVREVLRRAGVDISHVHTRPGATATQHIHLGPGGERHFPEGGYDPGVLTDFRLGRDDLAFITTCDVVMAPYFRQVVHLFHPAIEAARSGSRRVADLLDGADLAPDLAGIDDLLGLLDLAFISGDETTVSLLLSRSRPGGPGVVVTHGAAGSTALVGGRRVSVPAVPVPAEERVDTTGCGDAFQAAFTVAYVTHGDATAALQAGSRAAAAVIRQLGAIAMGRPR
jgi:fructoselysine 6-kinase